MTTLNAVKKTKLEPSAEATAAKELVRLAAEQGLWENAWEELDRAVETSAQRIRDHFR